MSAAKVDYYKVRQTFGVLVDGEQQTLAAGTLLSPDDPVVKQFSKAAMDEHLEAGSFASGDLFPRGSFARGDVEQATAAPGEKRGDKSPTVERATKK